MTSLHTLAVLLEKPGHLRLERVGLCAPDASDVLVEVQASGISTGTEKLLWNGRMPHFPGMGYPLVPGYESVGEVMEAGAGTALRCGDWVFVPGARCYPEVRSLFGGTARRLVVPATRAVRVDPSLGERAALLALAATAHHALHLPHVDLPELIVGHGVLGRLIARLTLVLGGAAPTVWERDSQRRPDPRGPTDCQDLTDPQGRLDPDRSPLHGASAGSPPPSPAVSFSASLATGAVDYPVLEPEDDRRRDYRVIFDASGDASQLDQLIARMAPGGQLVLAGFYADPLHFSFAPAFMREASIRVAAEWKEHDLQAVRRLVESGYLSLDGLITHRMAASAAQQAYATAFGEPGCLKMILDWSACP
jgi:3-hydroxyethyl bacteriochlorophyllide a dehydrogenase